jgi:hypothetical protein
MTSAMLLTYFIAILLVLKAIADIGQQQRYSCPACGTKRQDAHAPDCPWARAHK